MDPVETGTVEVVVKLVEFDTPNKNGQVFSYANFQRLIDGNFMAEITNKRLFGEYFPAPGDRQGIVDIDMDNICLRIKRVRLTPAGLFGVAVPAGPLKDVFLDYVRRFQQPIPLAMRALMQPDPTALHVSVEVTDPNNSVTINKNMDVLRIITFDLAVSALQGHSLVDLTAPPPPPVDIEQVAAKPAYAKPTLKEATEEQRAKIDNLAQGLIRTELEPYFQKAFDTYATGLQDPDVQQVLGEDFKYLQNDAGRILEYRAGGDIWRLVSDADGSPIRVEKQTVAGLVMSSHSRDVRNAFDLLALTMDERAKAFTDRPVKIKNSTTFGQTTSPDFKLHPLKPSRNKDRKMNTPAPKVKKPSAKQVFKDVDPIVSKNVLVHFQGAFRVRPGTKIDGHLKKLDGKPGAFVRKEGDPDVYVLPYTVLSQKKSAAERSLRDALATRKITIVDTADLK